MSKEKEIIRLNHQGLSQRSTCKMLKTSDRKIRQVLKKIDELNLTYDEIKKMSDEEFINLFSKSRKEAKLIQK